MKADPTSLLDRVLHEAEISIIDVGARGKPRRELAALGAYSRFIAVEPEPEEAARLEQALNESKVWKSVTLLTDALGSKPGTAILNVTAKPGLTSLLEPNPAVTRRFYNAGGYAIETRVEVELVRLDDAAQRLAFTDASFIKLDTQGTELDILRSGEELVERSLIGVYTEANLHEIYTGQDVFADVDAWLRGKGFILAEMRPSYLRGQGYDKEIYSRRLPGWAHCLYLRDPDTLVVADAADTKRRIGRFLAFALTYEHFDLALALFRDERIGPIVADEWPGLSKEVVRYARKITAGKLRGLDDAQREDLLRSATRQ